jgi:tRNA U38,U39,U40 pseudouridine synthase TruA
MTLLKCHEDLKQHHQNEKSVLQELQETTVGGRVFTCFLQHIAGYDVQYLYNIGHYDCYCVFIYIDIYIYMCVYVYTHLYLYHNVRNMLCYVMLWCGMVCMHGWMYVCNVCMCVCNVM